MGILLVAAYFVMRPTGGTLIVTVAGPGGRMVDGVEVFVDGDKKCATSPCKIEGIGAGAHLIRATAVGYQPTADQAVSVAAGEQNTHNVSLVKASATGIKVTTVGSGLRLYVDGREVGPLPQTVTDLSPGQHTIKVGGNSRYKDLEQSVTVEPDAVQEIGPLKLEVLKGLATFKAGPGADGAKVLVDGRLVPTLPTTVEVPAGKTPQLEARKPGYATYRRTISFDDGVAEKTFEITMVEDSGGGGYTPPPSPRPSQGTSRTPSPRPRPAPARRRQPAAGKAMLNMNSIPVSNVILNGRPLGPTPKVGISVAPGPVTVVFVHPELGRKVQSATVTAGSKRTFMARFR
jgi:serine/threonine-protein kinase